MLLRSIDLRPRLRILAAALVACGLHGTLDPCLDEARTACSVTPSSSVRSRTVAGGIVPKLGALPNGPRVIMRSYFAWKAGAPARHFRRAQDALLNGVEYELPGT